IAMRRMSVMLGIVILLSGHANAQTTALNAYFDSKVLRDQAAGIAKQPPASRGAADIRGLLPHRNNQSFSSFVEARQSRNLLDLIDALRLNKMLTTPPGGGISVVSRVAAPAVLGAAIEYGSVLERTVGTVTTLRANALGLGRMLFGVEQFPYCPE